MTRSAPRVKVTRKGIIFTMMLIGILGATAFICFRPRDMGETAKSYSEALFRADVDYLYNQAPEFERNLLSLTPTQLEQFSERFVKPKLIGVSIINHSNQRSQKLSGTGFSQTLIRLKNGRELDLTTYANLTDTGAVHRFKNIFITLWMIDYFSTHNVEPTSELGVRAWYEGVHRDAELLNSIGVKGWVSNGYPYKLSTWSEVEIRALAALQSFEAARTKAKSSNSQ